MADDPGTHFWHAHSYTTYIHKTYIKTEFFI